ncbi:hypothetical protein P875_00042816 [Aspergillus parasiticus SU-1]|uniref:Uncharacterized protein n=1 Tax=Aspergillus parasiticus (strain ATCC 56775 / NRRL 5862 / SRRC 143 / SU-1) TaxID=1403190 RepID=A0A0F0HZG0_ASPPU|nr:hypothetical protein P875_00042816 [Aspergillus parasiticus SU-1]
MFDWKSAPSDGSSAVSSQFWIYWATAVPLTAVTLGGWALWWNFEKHRYDVHITEAVTPRRAKDSVITWGPSNAIQAEGPGFESFISDGVRPGQASATQ